jgi:hypothetical protein
VTFSYSRTAGFDPNVQPNVSILDNDTYGRRCPLCRNSVPIVHYIGGDNTIKDISEKLINIAVDTARNTITHPMVEVKTDFQKRMEVESGACSTTSARGFRPFSFDNGTTLGY